MTAQGGHLPEVRRKVSGHIGFSGRSRNFKTEGRGRILRSGVCFDAPSHITYVFVVRLVN